MGIENIKLILSFAFRLQAVISQVLRDKKVKWMEFMLFFPLLTQLEEVLSSAKAAKEEIKDLSDEEKEELKKFVADNFDLEEDNVEEKIERALSFIVEIVDFVFDVK